MSTKNCVSIIVITLFNQYINKPLQIWSTEKKQWI